MLGRYGLIVLLCVGIAMAIITANMFDALERMYACSHFGSADACCEKGECKYRPASDESKPYRP